MLTIDIETARRFVLGKQGLWPGRRWRGAKGTEQAMRAIELLGTRVAPMVRAALARGQASGARLPGSAGTGGQHQPQ